MADGGTIMTQSEVLSWALTLPAPEQIQLVRDLAANLPPAKENPILIEAGQSYAIWSPHSSFHAAGAMLDALGLTEVTS